MKVFYWGKFTRYKWYSKQFLSPFLTYLQIGIDKFAYIYEVIQDTEWPHKQVRGSNQEKLKLWLIYSYVSFFVVWHLTWPHWQKSRLWMKGAEQNCDKHMGYLQIEHIQSIQSETTIKNEQNVSRQTMGNLKIPSYTSLKQLQSKLLAVCFILSVLHSYAPCTVCLNTKKVTLAWNGCYLATLKSLWHDRWHIVSLWQLNSTL